MKLRNDVKKKQTTEISWFNISSFLLISYYYEIRIVSFFENLYWLKKKLLNKFLTAKSLHSF